MKALTFSLGLLSLLFSNASFSGDITFDRTKGKLEIFSDFLGGASIKIKQGKLIERDPSGKQVQQFKVKSHSNSWTGPILTDGIYTTTYASGEKADGFSMSTTVYFGVLTTSSVENVLCSDCSSGTSGVCQSSATKACKPLGLNGRCPRRFLACRETKIEKKNTMSLSYTINWRFKDPANTLHYELEINTKKPKGKLKKSSSPISLQDAGPGLLSVPTTAIVRAADGAKRVIQINYEIEYGEKKNTLSFEFPSFGPDEDFFFN